MNFNYKIIGLWICDECQTPQPEPRATNNGDGSESYDTSCISCKHDECSYTKPPQGTLYTYQDQQPQDTQTC